MNYLLLKDPMSSSQNCMHVVLRGCEGVTYISDDFIKDYEMPTELMLFIFEECLEEG